MAADEMGLVDGRDEVVCQWCDGSGEANNPLNADPNVALLDWHAPVLCPRCVGTGKDPDGTPHQVIDLRRVVAAMAAAGPPSCDGSGGFGPPKGSGLIGWHACPGCARCKP